MFDFPGMLFHGQPVVPGSSPSRQPCGVARNEPVVPHGANSSHHTGLQGWHRRCQLCLVVPTGECRTLSCICVCIYIGTHAFQGLSLVIQRRVCSVWCHSLNETTTSDALCRHLPHFENLLKPHLMSCVAVAKVAGPVEETIHKKRGAVSLGLHPGPAAIQFRHPLTTQIFPWSQRLTHTQASLMRSQTSSAPLTVAGFFSDWVNVFLWW